MSTTYRLSALMLLALVAFAPLGASAATKKPSCDLTVTTAFDEATFDKKETVLVNSGDQVTIAWESSNATKAIDADKQEVALEGSASVSPTRTTTYSYRFTSGSKKVDCAVTLKVVDVSVETGELDTDNDRPTISGEASGTKSVRVELANEDGKIVFKSKNVRIKSGDWEVRVTKPLADGTYDLSLFGAKEEISLLATGTLKIEDGEATLSTSSGVSGGALSVAALPLLSGGNASVGASVPVAYIKVANPGKAPASVKGFTMKQNGSASTDAIYSFSTNDDKGGSRATVLASGKFKNGSMFVPLEAVVAPGQTRIFTIKAALVSNSNTFAGQTLMLDVAGVDSGAKASGAFPIRGVTWTLLR